MHKYFKVSLVILVSLCVAGTVLALRQKPTVRFTALNIGQGDALFFETSSHQQMLIDGGPDNTVVEQLGRVMPFFDRTIDVVVMTHPDADHSTGLIAVARKYHIKKFVFTGIVGKTATYKTLLRELDRRHVPLQYVHAGDQLTFSDSSTFAVLGPLESWEGKSTDKANNTSVVGKFQFHNFSVLTTGDIEKEVEAQLVNAYGSRLHGTILKVAHHGSHTSSSEPFLKAVDPEAAVISVGLNNKFHHPHQDVLDRYMAFHIPVFRTDLLGPITISSDGTTFHIRHGLSFRFW